MHPMDEKIISVIHQYEYPMWFIIRDNLVDCTCVDYHTKQADPHCKKCLGTGKKIRAVRMKAAHQNDKISMRGDGIGGSEYNIIPVFYSLNDAGARENDLVVDGDEVFIIQHYYAEHSNESKPVYYKLEGANKKNNRELFLKLFHEAMEKAGFSS